MRAPSKFPTSCPPARRDDNGLARKYHQPGGQKESFYMVSPISASGRSRVDLNKCVSTSKLNSISRDLRRGSLTHKMRNLTGAYALSFLACTRGDTDVLVSTPAGVSSRILKPTGKATRPTSRRSIRISILCEYYKDHLAPSLDISLFHFRLPVAKRIISSRARCVNARSMLFSETFNNS